MKHFFILSVTLMLCATGWAQDYSVRKPLESNVMIGAGLFGETGNRARNLFPGAVLRLSYGLDMKLGERWSVMPGTGIRTQLGEVHLIGAVGGDPEAMSLADVFCQVRRHLEFEGTQMVFGLGPQFSYMTAPDTYYIDADPNDPLNRKEKFERWDLGLQPCILFRNRRHWQWGFEASVGLRNMLRQYPEYHVTGSVHLHNILFVCGWRF